MYEAHISGGLDAAESHEWLMNELGEESRSMPRNLAYIWLFITLFALLIIEKAREVPKLA